MPLPKSVADQRNRRSTLHLFIGSQCPPQQRCHAKRLEEPGGYSRGTDALRIASVCEVGSTGGKGSESHEALALLAPRRDVGIGGRNLGHTQLKTRIVRPDDGESIRLREWQRPEQRSVDQAENGRVRPDTEREREHGHGGEAGVFQQLA